MNVKYAANSLNVTAAGDSKKYKVAPDQKGVDVDLSDVHRTSGDSELPPRGTSHFMFGIEKDSADGGYREQLTDFAAGFTKQCLQRGMNYSSFCAAVKQASVIDGVGEELACLTKCSSAVAADFEKAAFAPVVNALTAAAKVSPRLLAKPLVAAGKYLRGGTAAARAAAQAAPTAAKATPGFWPASLPTTDMGVGKMLLPAGKPMWFPGAAKALAGTAPTVTKGTPRASAKWWQFFTGPADLNRLGGKTIKGPANRAARMALGAWRSPFGHTARGGLVGGTVGTFGLNPLADLAGWEDHPDFGTLGMLAGAGARFRTPGSTRSLLTNMIRAGGASPIDKTIKTFRNGAGQWMTTGADGVAKPFVNPTGAASNVTRWSKFPERLFTIPAARWARPGAKPLPNTANASVINNITERTLPNLLAMPFGLPWLGRGRHALSGNVYRGILGVGAGSGFVHGMAKSRGEEAARAYVDAQAQRYGYPNAEAFHNSAIGQFMQAYNAPDGGIIPGVRAYWGALTDQQKALHLAGAGALVGGGAMLAGGQGLPGAAMMGLGGLGLAHGMGAFGSTPGSAQSLFNSAPSEIKQQLSQVMQHPDFLQAGPAQQAEIIKEILQQYQQQKSQLELARG